jgi:hypothetical protein
MARDVTAEAHCDHLETGVNEVVNAFADTIKFLDLDLAAIFQTDSVATIDLNRLSAWAGGWPRATFVSRNGQSSPKPIERCARPAWIASALGSGDLDPKNAHVELETALPQPAEKRRSRPTRCLGGRPARRACRAMREIEERSREAAVRSVRARHQAAVPRGALGEMRVIRGEIGRKRARMPLRKLMKAAGGTIQKIKPVFLMSPVSVAQFLPPGSVDFDLLVIDEAS